MRVEAARLGTVFGHNQKAYRRWRRDFDRSAKRVAALTGAALESAVMNVARMFPGNVERGTMPKAG